MPRSLFAAAALAVFAMAPAAQAQQQTVSAKNPQGIVDLLDIAGYKPELQKDDYGDPLIYLELDGWKVDMVFYGCGEDTNADCDSIQLSTGFDTENGLTQDAAMSISEKFRFASVSLDEENDVYVRWDIIMGEGIPSKVFLQALRYYTDTLDSASQIIFPEDAAEAAAEAVEAAAETGEEAAEAN